MELVSALARARETHAVHRPGLGNGCENVAAAACAVVGGRSHGCVTQPWLRERSSHCLHSCSQLQPFPRARPGVSIRRPVQGKLMVCRCSR